MHWCHISLLWDKRLVGVYIHSTRLQLTDESHSPGHVIIHRNIEDTINVGGARDSFLEKRKGVFSAEPAHEETHLEDYILASALFLVCRIIFRRGDIVWAQYDDRT